MSVFQKFIAWLMSFFAIIMSLFGIKTEKPKTYDTDFTVKTYDSDAWNGESIMFCGQTVSARTNRNIIKSKNVPSYSFAGNMTLSIDDTVNKSFNYYSLVYSASEALKITMNYIFDGAEATDVFYITASEEPNTFSSFIPEYESDTKAVTVKSLTIEDFDGDDTEFSLLGLSVFNRESPADLLTINTNGYKLSASTEYGGALVSVVNTADNIQTVKLSDGTYKTDIDALKKYGGLLISSEVNLINTHDTGRIVQQSYYGTNGKYYNDYSCGRYQNRDWPYNPVQAGNTYGDKARLIDCKIDNNSVYVKSTPMDWAKDASSITKSYMESKYTVIDEAIKCDCTFTDFSGYVQPLSNQELPAFYTLSSFDTFAYYRGLSPWTDEKLTFLDNLGFGQVTIRSIRRQKTGEHGAAVKTASVSVFIQTALLL